jgi:polysaccharide deacetylase family protein (PEP-CTERM system associated)
VTTPTPAPPAPVPPVNVMSIDVEDYFHASAFAALHPRLNWNRLEHRVESNTLRLLDILAEFKVHGTFFVLGWVADRYPTLVRRISEAGHEIASHSFWHRLVYDLSPADFRDDLRRARDVLQAATGVRVRGFRAPSYSIVTRSLWALDVLIEEGYEYDASIFPIRHDRYGIPTAPRHAHRIERSGGSILEVPGSTAIVGGWKVPIGGGYFRLAPYSVTRWAMRRVNDVDGHPAVFYLHPWEIDPKQPRLPGGRVTKWRHYNKLSETEPRLRQLLRDFRFDRIDRVLLDAAPGDGRTVDATESEDRPVGRVRRKLESLVADVQA